MILPINERYINELTGIELDDVDVPADVSDDEEIALDTDLNKQWNDYMTARAKELGLTLQELLFDEENLDALRQIHDNMPKFLYTANKPLQEPIEDDEPLMADFDISSDDVDESVNQIDLPILEGSTLTVSDDDDNYKLFDEAKKKKTAKKKLPIRKDYKKSCSCC